MKQILLFSILIFGLISCSSDDDSEPQIQLLSYDGENDQAPSLPGGNHEMAVRFPSFVTGDFEGKNLSGVQVYMYNIPNELRLNLYTAGSAAGPDFSSIIQYDVSGLAANQWNEITLNDPMPISGDLWISFSWSQSGQSRIIGCDSGPANPNGDWIFLSTDTNGWQTFRDLTGTESVNWNIRGVVTD